MTAELYKIYILKYDMMLSHYVLYNEDKKFEGGHIMSKVVFFNSYKLKKGVSVPDFLLAAEKLINEYASKQKGFISSKIAVDGETWADFTTFETMEDAKKFAQSSDPSGLAEKFYSFINFNSCTTRFFAVEASY